MNISRYLDHAVLKPNLTEQEVRDAIQAGIDHRVYSVCVRPCDIDLALEMCEGTDTLVTCVLDFPPWRQYGGGQGRSGGAVRSKGRGGNRHGDELWLCPFRKMGCSGC